MNLTVRLYYPSDADLIALRCLYRRGFQRLIRDSLSAVMRGERFQISVPPNISNYVRQIEEPMFVSLSIEDPEMIEFFHNIGKRLNTRTIKAIIRYSYTRFPYEVFFIPSDMPSGDKQEVTEKPPETPVKTALEKNNGAPEASFHAPEKKRKEKYRSDKTGVPAKHSSDKIRSDKPEQKTAHPNGKTRNRNNEKGVNKKPAKQYSAPADKAEDSEITGILDALVGI